MTSADLLAYLKKHPIGFTCGLLSLILGGLIYYRSGELPALQEEYEAKSAEAARITANVTVSRSLPEQVAEIQAFTKDLESRLVRAGQLAVNLQYFYKLEAESQVKPVDVRQGSPLKNSAPPFTGIPYNVTVQGSFNQVLDFIKRLENGRHFCRFNNVSFSKVPGDSTGTGIAVTMNLELLGQP